MRSSIHMFPATLLVLYHVMPLVLAGRNAARRAQAAKSSKIGVTAAGRFVRVASEGARRASAPRGTSAWASAAASAAALADVRTHDSLGTLGRTLGDDPEATATTEAPKEPETPTATPEALKEPETPEATATTEAPKEPETPEVPTTSPETSQEPATADEKRAEQVATEPDTQAPTPDDTAKEDVAKEEVAKEVAKEAPSANSSTEATATKASKSPIDGGIDTSVVIKKVEETEQALNKTQEIGEKLVNVTEQWQTRNQAVKQSAKNVTLSTLKSNEMLDKATQTLATYEQQVLEGHDPRAEGRRHGRGAQDRGAEAK